VEVSPKCFEIVLGFAYSYKKKKCLSEYLYINWVKENFFNSSY